MDCSIGETKRFAVIKATDFPAVWKLLKIENVIFKDTKIKIQRPKGFFVRHFEGGRYIIDE